MYKNNIIIHNSNIKREFVNILRLLPGSFNIIIISGVAL